MMKSLPRWIFCCKVFNLAIRAGLISLSVGKRILYRKPR